MVRTARLKRLLTRNHFEELNQHSGPDKTPFNEDRDMTMWLVMQSK